MRKTTVEDQEFDEFLHKVDVIVKLRLSAEQQYKSAPHSAYSRRLTLPLDWKQIYAILYPDTQSPPESLITNIARSCVNETESIIGNMRKVLHRKREKVSLGLVQQVDPHCLRWLSKQPGRNAIEKAGARQKILAIVRRENFNTLENRVFKDFLARTCRESVFYLKTNKSCFDGHPTINIVKRLRHLCTRGLQEPMLETVNGITDLPAPNYVLRQERRYTKIWKAYCKLLRQAHIAERLWLKKDELNTTYENLHREANIHINPKARYHCPLWLNPPDGRKTILDKPFYTNEFSLESLPCNPAASPPSRGDVIIDLTGQSPDWDLLIYGHHENAKPYLQNYSRPSIEDLEGSNHIFLHDLLKDARADNKQVRTRLRHYFEQLKGKIGGSRWFVLIPDEWDALWQETIIKSIPLARSDVFLLWRSIAAAIGVLDQLNSPCDKQTLAIIDIQQGGVTRLSTIFLVKSETGTGYIPQRKSHMRHKNLYKTMTLESKNQVPERDAFLFGHQDTFFMNTSQFKEIYFFCQEANHTVLINNIGVHIENSKWISDSDWLTVSADAVHKGVRRFVQQRDADQVPYYDELEALSLIVQTEAEQIVATMLVHANERWPGGQEVITDTDTLQRAAVLKSHSNHVDLYLCMGDATPTTPLKKKKHDFQEVLEEDQALDLSARITPGQGMAVVTVMSDFLRDPIELDFLQGMKEDSRFTMADLENRIDRSFPPDAPHVESDFVLWSEVKYDIQNYLAGRIEPEGEWFAKARGKYIDTPLPRDAGPLERLRRINVFGNRKGYPFQFDCDREQIFSKLAHDFNTLHGLHNEVIRLIA